MAKADINLKQIRKKIKSDQQLKILVNMLIKNEVLNKPSLKFVTVQKSKEDFFSFIANIYSSKADEKKDAIELAAQFCHPTKVKNKSGVDALVEEIDSTTQFYLGSPDKKEQKKGKFLQNLVKVLGSDVEVEEEDEFDFEEEEADEIPEEEHDEIKEILPEDNEATELQERIDYLAPLAKEAVKKGKMEPILKVKLASLLLKDLLGKGKKDFLAVKEALDVAEASFADNEDFDDGEELMDLEMMQYCMKNMYKKDGEKSYPFACCGQKEDFTLALHKLKKANILAKNLKRETGESKISFGSATIEKKSKTIVLDIEEVVIPNIYKSMKVWIRNNKPLPIKRIQLKQAGRDLPVPKDELEGENKEYGKIVSDALSRCSAGTLKDKITKLWNEVKTQVERSDTDNPKVNHIITAGLSTLDDLIDQIEDHEKWKTQQVIVGKLYEKAMKTNPDSRTRLQAMWAMAVENADALRFVVAVKLAEKLKPQLEDIIGEEEKEETPKEKPGSKEKQEADPNLIENEKKWEKEQKEVGALFLEAMKLNPDERTKLQAIWAMAVENADASKFSTALKLTDRLKPMLQSVLKTNINIEDQEESKDTPTVDWSTARVVWDKTSDYIDDKINELQKFLLRSGDKELVAIGKYGFSAVTGNFRQRFMAEMINVGFASDKGGDIQKEAARSALKTLEGFRQYVSSSKQLEAIDENPFKVEVKIKKTLLNTLNTLEKTLNIMAGN